MGVRKIRKVFVAIERYRYVAIRRNEQKKQLSLPPAGSPSTPFLLPWYTTFFLLSFSFFLSHVLRRVLHKVRRFISLRGICVRVPIQSHLVSLVDKLLDTFLSVFSIISPPPLYSFLSLHGFAPVFSPFLFRAVTFRKSYVNFQTTKPFRSRARVIIVDNTGLLEGKGIFYLFSSLHVSAFKLLSFFFYV